MALDPKTQMLLIESGGFAVLEKLEEVTAH